MNVIFLLLALDFVIAFPSHWSWKITHTANRGMCPGLTTQSERTAIPAASVLFLAIQIPLSCHQHLMWSPSPTVEAPTEEGCISVADTVLFPVGAPISSLTPAALPGTLSVAGVPGCWSCALGSCYSNGEHVDDSLLAGLNRYAPRTNLRPLLWYPSQWIVTKTHFLHNPDIY